MGDIADAMICGEMTDDGLWVGEEASHSDGYITDNFGIGPIGKKVKCPKCSRLIKTAGLLDHVRLRHNADYEDVVNGILNDLSGHIF